MGEASELALGAVAPDFALLGTDGKTWRLADLRGPKGTIVMFLANHCPYVAAAIARIVRDAAELESHGVRSVAIMANDPALPGNTLDNMTAFAQQNGLAFPYLNDETQAVARTYGAACTPDFFGFDFDLKLAYHGRLDAGGLGTEPVGRRELFEAMTQIAIAGKAPAEQHRSVGCAIQWREAA